MGIPRDLYQDRLRQGLCPQCGGVRDQDTKRCSICAADRAAVMRRCRRNRAKRGLCAACPAKISTGRYCTKCKKIVTATTGKIYAARRRTNSCTWCDAPRVASRFCKPCWFRSMSLRVFGTVVHGPQLYDLFISQEGRCFYTGAELTPGVNAGLDHQVPVRRGGAASIQNLRWVTIQLNRVKNDLTHDEFLELCNTVGGRFHKPTTTNVAP